MIVPTRAAPLGLFLLTLGAAPTMAQSLQSLGQAAGGMLSGQSGGSSMGGMSGMGGSLGGMSGSLGGLLGKASPAVSSAPTSNLGGVLSYCVQNNVLQGSNASSATSALGSLTGRQGVGTTQPGYVQGAQGTLESGNGNALSLNSLPAPARTKVCDMVLSRAKSMM